MDNRCFAWDWRAQPPMDEIAGLVNQMSAEGRVFVQEFDTGGDTYAWTVASRKLTEADQMKLYQS